MMMMLSAMSAATALTVTMLRNRRLPVLARAARFDAVASLSRSPRAASSSV
jgi:hypothetical protein